MQMISTVGIGLPLFNAHSLALFISITAFLQ